MNAVNFRPDIQGLRAIAVFSVMAFHFNPALLPGGFIGVDLFFVISGFLITNILLHRKENADFNLAKTLNYFYLSRFKRIAPAYFVMLVVVAFVAAVFLLPQDFNTFKSSLESAAWFGSNRYFSGFGDYFSPANHEQPLLHSWSLAVEIQFYLLMPFMILLLPVRWLQWIFAGLFIGFSALAEYNLRIIGIEQATYYSLYARLPEFFAGSLAALYTINTSESLGGSKWLGTVGLMLIFIAAIAQPQLGAFPGIAALLPVAGGVLLLSQHSAAGSLLSCKMLVWFGALSYSLYLWHWPVLAFLRYYTGTEILGAGFSLLFILLTLVLSIASYYGIERLLRSQRTNKKQALAWGLLVAVVLGTSQAMVKVNAALTPEQLPIEYLRYGDDSKICHGHIAGDCIRGDIDSVKEVLVLGDSHAAMLNLFFDYLGKELGFKARVITASSCVTIPGFDYKRIAEWAHHDCLAQIEQAKTYIENAEVIFLAASWNWHLKSREFNQGLINFLKNDASHAKKYVISQEPLLNLHPQRNQRFVSLGLVNRSGVNTDYLRSNENLKSITIKLENTKYLELDVLPIFEHPPFYKGQLLYYDEHHLNEIAVMEYAKQALPIFKEIFIGME
ncbi:acyltransferase family protein [Aeromonas veronii]|uniref:acyltransferase family protein n=1 Tax=Aeromonas TaxID=642 RepID=UPI003BA015CC